MTRRQYLNPPIREALCEVRFSSGGWSFETPAKLYERLKTSYPAEPAQIVAPPMVEADPSGPALVRSIQPPRLRFATSDGTAGVVVGPGALSVHLMPPYPGWEVFRDRLEEAFAVYVDVTGGTGVARIGVRYVNEIHLGVAPVDLEDYFTLAPDVPEQLNMTLASFFLRVESISEERAIRLVRTFGSAQSEPGDAVVILDLDAIRTWDGEGLGTDQAIRAAEDVRDFEREAFESLLTDKLRERFDA